ncbi:MAG: hypothetical protein LBQ52_00890, partial [Helicobacteraceae bacterium]|nr:hypothetical protein [Helicobacteraceae bacterium]
NSLNLCFNDYTELSTRFDAYRVAVAKTSSQTPIAQSRTADAHSSRAATACLIIEDNPITDALNALNGDR